MPGDVHVTPCGDLLPHVDAPTCWCGPTRDPAVTRSPYLWVHHSADGREEDEHEAERLTATSAQRGH